MKKYLFEIIAVIAVLLAVGVTWARAERVPVSASAGLVTSGSFITSSSTIFAVQNPLAATSTVTFAQISGQNGATSTDIMIATSTTPSPAGLSVSTSTLNENIMGLFNTGAGKQFYSVAGASIGSNVGYNNPAGDTYKTTGTFVVGPNEWVIGFATSTNPSGNGGLGIGSLGVPTSGTYKLIWVQ